MIIKLQHRLTTNNSKRILGGLSEGRRETNLIEEFEGEKMSRNKPAAKKNPPTKKQVSRTEEFSLGYTPKHRVTQFLIQSVTTGRRSRIAEVI